ncbi:MAG: XdhC family protein [Gemmatales bacterium]|nr:XdhC family protein [Gemmatales bacterium]MDW8388124.1 XdhC family protein [Gemmatales bacterium]
MIYDMREILVELMRLIENGIGCVLCVLVETRGSTPQKAGAAMLVLADGSQRGTLGGGCVEAEVKQKSLRLLDATRPELLVFHLDDTYGWDDGLICGGRMSILATPFPGGTVEPMLRAFYRRYRDAAQAGTGCTEAIVFQTQPHACLPIGSRFLFDGNRSLLAAWPVAEAPVSVTSAVIPLEERPRPYVRQGVAFLPLLPRIRLLIVGAGHVGQAVAHLASQADFDVWVLDDRAAYANAERFPEAQRLIVGDIGRELQRLREDGIDPMTYALIVTRGHRHDEEALYHLAESRAGYVGMIGSRRKIRLIFDDLVARGIRRESLARVYAPLGVPIGSQTVPEIAVSIVAELIAHRNLGGVPAQLRPPSVLHETPP